MTIKVRTTVSSLHDKAMDLYNRGDLRNALDWELRASRKVPITEKSEPTLGILYRSCASIALQLGRPLQGLSIIGEYRRCATKAPQQIIDEIAEVEAQLKALIPSITLEHLTEIGLT